jgi:cyclopropane-fatty-acyl-phospholipid synthase
MFNGLRSRIKTFFVAVPCLAFASMLVLSRTIATPLTHAQATPTTTAPSSPTVVHFILKRGEKGLPSIALLRAALEPNFVTEDWHNFGPHYVPTLLAWHANFEHAWPSLEDKYGERFRRMWRYYLLNSAGAFRA